MCLCKTVEAHRLDECLQATLVELSDPGLEIDLTLTPGIESARHFLWLLDTDSNGSLDADEGRRFGWLVLRSLTVHLDRQPLAPGLREVQLPTKEDLLSGVGRIEIHSTTRWSVSTGVHAVSFTNLFAADRSVYLANALLPKNPSFSILSQQRNVVQSGFEIAFQKSGTPWPWEMKLGLVAAFLGALVLGSVARPRKSRSPI